MGDKYNVILGTAFYITNKQGVNVKSSNHLQVYFRCICVFFASIYRFYPEQRKELFTNSIIPEEFRLILQNYNVVITVLEEKDCKYVNSPIISTNFPGCLFSLDVYRYLLNNKGSYNNFNSVLLLDNDTIVLKNFDDEIKELGKKIIGYKLDYDFQNIINGKSRATLSYVNLIHGKQKCVSWFGGEALGFNLEFCKTFVDEVEKYFSYFELDSNLLGNQLTEEHLFSIILSNEIERVQESKFFIKRVWTTYGYNNIMGNESEFKILHYPSEKHRLFKQIYKIIAKDSFYLSLLNDQDYLNICLSPIHKNLNPNLFLYIKRKLANIKKIAITKLMS